MPTSKRAAQRSLLLAVIACSGPKPTPPASQHDSPRIQVQASIVHINVTVGEPTQAARNRELIQQAIRDNGGKQVILQLPPGAIYVDRGERYSSIRFAGSNTTDLTLAGAGPHETRIVIQGDATGGGWLGIEIADGARRIALRDFSIEHGVIENRSPTQQDHLIQLNGQTAVTGDIEISNVFFGPCIGDALRIAGTAPNYVEHVKVHDFSMETAGQEQSREKLSRSGVGLQRGFKDVEIYSFRISGARGSPIDMEPTGSNVMEDLNIHDGVVDNSLGDTAYAVSLGGFEEHGSHVVHPLANSQFHDIVILQGLLNILDTASLSVTDVLIYASGDGPMSHLADPLLYVVHENSDLKFTRLRMTRDTGAAPGPLVLVNHGADTFTSNISFVDNLWVSHVDAGGRPPAYVTFASTQHVTLSNVRLVAGGAHPANAYGVRFRSSARDVTHISIDKLTIESPAGKLKAGIWLAATNGHELKNIEISNVHAENSAESCVLFDAADGSTIDAAPSLHDNHFAGCTKEWDAINAAATRVRPK